LWLDGAFVGGLLIRHDWTTEDVEQLYSLPLTELLFRAQTVHRQHHDPAAVQRCTLLSVKTGGCPEDCAYCPQSARYETGVGRETLMSIDEVLASARAAQAAGATRFCMGAAWREVKDGPPFERVLEMVRGVSALGMEACVTLGMLTGEQARRLKEAGLTAYNHNLDTSAEFYPSIISTRTYDDRLQTLARVQDAGLHVWCGGIVGMGESPRDRCAMIAQIGRLSPHPESVPVNALVPVEGTPLADAPELDPIELVRTVACPGPLLPGRRQLHLLGREAPDLAEPGARRGRSAVRPPRPPRARSRRAVKVVRGRSRVSRGR
jgi:biotin synthase